MLMVGVAWGEMPSVVNTSIGTSGYVFDTGGTISTGTPTWGEISISSSKLSYEGEGQVLIASAKQFDSNPKRRIIKVYVVDPNSNVPMDKCILYQSNEYLTDLTDQEIFFGLKFYHPKRTIIDVPTLNIEDFLKEYNRDRIKFLDKKLSRETGRDVYLEPVKIRELKMVIVNIATF
jgi:hypothetical protein